MQQAAHSDWHQRGQLSLSTPVRLTMAICSDGIVGDLDNKVKNTLDGLWVDPTHPAHGFVPLFDDDAVSQIVVTQLDTGVPQNSRTRPPLLLDAFLSTATLQRPHVYLRLDTPVTLEGLMA